MQSHTVLFLLVSVAISEGLQGESVHNLTILFISSFGKFGFNSSGAIPAGDIALERVNADPNVLPGYNLVYDKLRDSQVS